MPASKKNTDLIVRKGILISESNTEVWEVKTEARKLSYFSAWPNTFPTEGNKNISTDFEQWLRAALYMNLSCERGRKRKEGTSIEVNSHNLVLD